MFWLGSGRSFDSYPETNIIIRTKEIDTTTYLILIDVTIEFFYGRTQIQSTFFYICRGNLIKIEERILKLWPRI